MKYLSQFIAAFCGASVFIGGLYMLCPDGVMNKSVKYIFSLIFILTVVSAAAFSGGWDMPYIEPVVADADTEALQTAAAEYVFAEALKSEGIEFSKITVCTDKTETGSISISKVIIWSGDEKERILSALAEAAENIKVEIVND